MTGGSRVLARAVLVALVAAGGVPVDATCAAGTWQYLGFETGGSPGRMGRRAVAFSVVEDQGPTRSVFVVLPEPRGEVIDELQPRRSLVALPGLRIDRRSLVGIFRHRNEDRTSVPAV